MMPFLYGIFLCLTLHITWKPLLVMFYILSEIQNVLYRSNLIQILRIVNLTFQEKVLESV